MTKHHIIVKTICIYEADVEADTEQEAINEVVSKMEEGKIDFTNTGDIESAYYIKRENGDKVEIHPAHE